MVYEWDETKRQINLGKHGVDFAQVEAFEWETALREPSTREGEARTFALGYIGERLHALAYVDRGDNVRIISLRKANLREENRYAAS